MEDNWNSALLLRFWTATFQNPNDTSKEMLLCTKSFPKFFYIEWSILSNTGFQIRPQYLNDIYVR